MQDAVWANFVKKSGVLEETFGDPIILDKPQLQPTNQTRLQNPSKKEGPGITSSSGKLLLADQQMVAQVSKVGQ